ncbi:MULTISPECIES: glycosyltransferase family 4 protein [unclassified Actinomyces]|uniref:glycosyltransferase family 4 protein n=1 Tax=unclassified Actinomyces TaxID=2609248 RepID=UPI001373F4E7|nr:MULTISPECIES: glycosyltransferase family 4 protein [unclassified Actinomyces]MBW3069601.1 glycosyltransferase family 4 protein [Actinomyces sp. 594]NDR53222.1 glycosyltransferase family 4 protein [Actinomyces sp. 565]QHO90768.1 glycosyl transferase family 1 [Actinomyces sp. 432]
MNSYVEDAERPGARANSDRLRIMEVSGSAAGGMRAHVAECARILAQAGHDVIVEAPAEVIAGADFGCARTEPLTIGARPTPGDGAVIARLRRLGRRADVIHAHGVRAGALAGLALGRRRPGRARLVVTIHNQPIGGRLTTAVGNRLEQLVAARADHILAVSPDLAERQRNRGAERVELAVIPAPRRDEQNLAPRASSVESAWRGAPRRILTVARLAPQKGLELLLDAAALVAAQAADGSGRTPDLAWAVAGEGPGRAAAEARIGAESLPVNLLGRREDVPALMEAADVVVQTSLWEGQPIALQEALQAGAAIVATDVGGTAATARGGAILVPPQPQALADAITGLLRDAQARDRVRERARRAAERLPHGTDLAAQLEAVVAHR